MIKHNGRHYRKTGTTNINMELDKNERFVLGQCIRYAIRHLKLRLVFDEEVMTFLCWVLGYDMTCIGEHLIEYLDREQEEEFEEHLQENINDPDWYARTVVEMMQKLKIGHFGRFRQFVIEALRSRLGQLQYAGKSDLENNIANIGETFNLSNRETDLCTFLFIMESYDEPKRFFNTHLKCDRYSGRKYLTNILEVSEHELNRIISGNLALIGLLDVDSFNMSIEQEFLSFFQNPSDRSFTQDLYAPVTESQVPISDFLVDQATLEHMQRLLGADTDTATHILFYGLPGTGKTSLARALSLYLDLPAFEVLQGKENSAEKRRAALIACINRTSATKERLVIVDEADNLLNTQFSWLMRGETQDKGWLNQILEKPGVRLIWITNTISGIEDSVLRRFAFSLPFKPFNRRQRVMLWERIARRKKVKRYFTARQIETYARNYEISAGAIETAVQKAIEITPTSGEDFHRSISMSLNAYMALLNQGEKPLSKDRPERNYSLDGLNVSEDIGATMDQLRMFNRYLRSSDHGKTISMNLLFYGPPGTGKSELARYLATELDRELHVKHVSDLHSKWVGESEKNIRDAFLKAESEQAVLVIDEADSLLYSRDRARNSWEISFTNEFLARMERFRGILICSTNRIKDLDSASLRRFVVKLEFDYLTPDGNVIFYRKLLAGLVSKPVPSSVVRQLCAIDDLAPGDFSTVKKRFSIYPQQELNHGLLVRALGEETRLKKTHAGKRVVGF